MYEYTCSNSTAETINEAFSEAFSDCRDANRPIRVYVQSPHYIEEGKCFPSGRYEKKQSTGRTCNGCEKCGIKIGTIIGWNTETKTRLNKAIF